MSRKESTILCSNCRNPFHGLTPCVLTLCVPEESANRAVNSHDALLKASRQARRSLPYDEDEGSLYHILDAAIKLAEEGK